MENSVLRELPAAEKAVNGFLMKNTPELAEERTKSVIRTARNMTR